MKKLLKDQIHMTSFVFTLFFIATLSFVAVKNWGIALIGTIATTIAWRILWKKSEEYKEKFGDDQDLQ